MRRQHASLPVQVEDTHRPLAVLWRGRFLQVTGILDSWQWAGDWVTGVSEREYWLVSTEDGVVLELYRRLDDSIWVISGMPD